MRLSYLRNVEDPYGPRLISLNPSYSSNPYILAASLADVERWPELALPSSPHLSEDDGERPSGFPGATGLKHTQTIMGPSRSGALGMRVSGRRASLKRVSGTPRQGDVQNFLSENAPVQKAEDRAGPTSEALGERGGESWVDVSDAEKAPIIPSQSSAHTQNETTDEEAPVKMVQFIPKFKGAAEMEARRRMRMLARKPPSAVDAPPPPPANTVPINPELSSSEDDDVMLDDDEEDDFEDVANGNDSMGDDDFDP